MSAEPFRFLHAADLHLEQPLAALDEVPDHLRQPLIDAPLRAAEQLFDAAIVEEVDFVVLAGDVIDAEQADAGALAFLLAQFERLAQQGIAVYWAGGSVDPPDRWPGALSLPAGVRVFGDEGVETFVHLRDKRPLAALVGRSSGGRRVRPVDFRCEAEAPLAIAVAHGKADPQQLAASPIAYWAIGGRHGRKGLPAAPCTAIYPGTPQGRRPEEAGPHGCTLVRIDEEGAVHPRAVPCDVVRWHTEHLHVSAESTRESLEGEMRERLASLIETAGDRTLLVTWHVVGGGPLLVKLRRSGLTTEIAAALRGEFGFASPAAWTVGIETQPSDDVPPDFYEEDTILGDFLRALEACRAENAEPLDLESLLPAGASSQPLAALAELDESEQQQVLDEVATLAVDLLRGTEGMPS